MTITIPGPLQAIASVVVGADWPEADEDSLWRLQDAWTQAATSMEQVSQLGDDAARRVMQHVDGLIAQGFSEHWKGIGGDGGPIQALHDGFGALGDACDEFALKTEHAKLSIIAALVALAAEIASLVAASFATFGAASSGIPIAEAATQLTVRMILKELLVEMLKGAAINVGTEAAIQAYQVANHGTEAFDPGTLLSTGIDGAVAGAAGVGVGNLSKGLFGTTTSSAAGAALRGAGEGAVAGAYANALNGLRNNGEITTQDVVSGAASGTVSGSRDGVGTRLEGLGDTAYRGGVGNDYVVGRDSGVLSSDPTRTVPEGRPETGPGSMPRVPVGFHGLTYGTGAAIVDQVQDRSDANSDRELDPRDS